MAAVQEGFINVRKVWSAVTRRPRASVREIADEVGVAYGTAARHLRFLGRTGYIEVDRSKSRVRKIIIPCGVQHE